MICFDEKPFVKQTIRIIEYPQWVPYLPEHQAKYLIDMTTISQGNYRIERPNRCGKCHCALPDSKQICDDCNRAQWARTGLTPLPDEDTRHLKRVEGELEQGLDTIDSEYVTRSGAIFQFISGCLFTNISGAIKAISLSCRSVRGRIKQLGLNSIMTRNIIRYFQGTM